MLYCTNANSYCTISVVMHIILGSALIDKTVCTLLSSFSIANLCFLSCIRKLYSNMPNRLYVQRSNLVIILVLSVLYK